MEDWHSQINASRQAFDTVKVCRGSSDGSMRLRRGPVATLGVPREHSGHAVVRNGSPGSLPSFSKEGEFCPTTWQVETDQAAPVFLCF